MATPFKMKNSVLHKSATHGSPMQGNFISNVKKAAKKAYDLTMPKGLKKINKEIADAVTGGKGKAKKKSKVVDFSKKDSNYDVKFTKSEPKAKQTKTKKQTEIERYENDHINKKTGESLFKYKKSPAKNYKKGYYGA